MLPFKLEYMKKRDPDVGARQMIYVVAANEFGARLVGWARLREHRGQLADMSEWTELSCVEVTDPAQWPGENRNLVGAPQVVVPPVEPWKAAEYPNTKGE